MAIFMLLLPAKNFTESEFVMQALENSPQIRVALVEDDVNFQNALMVAIEDAPDMTLLGVAGTKTQGLPKDLLPTRSPYCSRSLATPC